MADVGALRSANLNPLPAAPLTPLQPRGLEVPAPGGSTQPSFKEFLLEALNHVNAMQQQADRAVEQLATGGDINPVEVLTAVQKADLSFRMMLQIRNKLVQAYQEIKDIRV